MYFEFRRSSEKTFLEILFFLESICYAVKRARPFLRRALTVLLPPVVFARFLKPCARALFLFLGWYVVDMNIIEGY